MSCVACAKDPPPARTNAAPKLPMTSVISQEQAVATTKKSSHALKYWNSVGSLFMMLLLASNETQDQRPRTRRAWRLTQRSSYAEAKHQSDPRFAASPGWAEGSVLIVT